MRQHLFDHGAEVVHLVIRGQHHQPATGHLDRCLGDGLNGEILAAGLAMTSGCSLPAAGPSTISLEAGMQLLSQRAKFTPYAGRRRTRQVMVGNVGVGGSNPIRVQSMTTTLTKDVDATVAQVIRLVEAGCEIVRITTPTVQDATALGETKAKLRAQGIQVPLVADIHFSPA